jgi:hypothetical protein
LTGSRRPELDRFSDDLEAARGDRLEAVIEP